MQKEALKSLHARIERAIQEQTWQYPEQNKGYDEFKRSFVKELLQQFYHAKQDGKENRQYYKEAATFIAKYEWAVKNKGDAIKIMEATTFQDEKEKAAYDIFSKDFITKLITMYYDPEESTTEQCLETAQLLAINEWLTNYEEIRSRGL